MPSPRSCRWILLPVMIVLSAVVGCSGNSGPKESQVAVKVNDGEISAHQVQAVLLRQSRTITEPNEDMAAKVLEVLVDQELAAQAAVSSGLHKNPDVIQSLELQRREVLARTYHDRIADRTPGPSSDEIDRYYDGNPALFAERRLYLIQETAVAGEGEDIALLRAAMPKVRGPVELQATLERLRLEFSARQYAQSAEEVPLSLLPAFAKLKSGDSLLIAQPGGARIFTIVHVHLAPVDRRAAAPAIARFLLTERQRRQVGEAMTELRKSATLQYSAAYARREPAASAPVPGASQRQDR